MMLSGLIGGRGSKTKAGRCDTVLSDGGSKLDSKEMLLITIEETARLVFVGLFYLRK